MTLFCLRLCRVCLWLRRLPVRWLAACLRGLTRAAGSLKEVSLRDQLAGLERENQALRDALERRNSKIVLLEEEKKGLALLNEANLQRTRALIIQLGGTVGTAPRERGTQ